MFRFFQEPIVNISTFTSSFDSGAVESTPYTRGCIFLLQVGGVTGTNPTLDVKIQDSPDGVVWTDIPGLVFPQVTTSIVLDKLPFQADFLNKFFRTSSIIGGTSPQFPMSVIAVFEERIQP